MKSSTLDMATETCLPVNSIKAQLIFMSVKYIYNVCSTLQSSLHKTLEDPGGGSGGSNPPPPPPPP